MGNNINISAQEAVLFKKIGGEMIGTIGRSGFVKLTNRRLMQESLTGKVKVNILLEDIIAYQNGVLYSSHNTILIHTRDGFIFKFFVKRRKQLIKLLKQQIPVLEELPHETEYEAQIYSIPDGHPSHGQDAVLKTVAKGANVALVLVRVFCVLFVIIIAISIIAAIKDGSLNDIFQSFKPEIQMVKEGTLNAYPNKSVGKAFDDFITDAKWSSGVTADGRTFVNVTGTVLYLNNKVEAVIQFYVDVGGGTFEYNACEFNGVPQNDFIFWALLEKIYE